MTILETIDNILDIVATPEEERDRFRQMMLITSIIIAIKEAPVPDDFTVGETEEELQKAYEAASEVLENNPKARVAIGEYFEGVLEAFAGSLPKEKLESARSTLEEFRA